MAAVADVAAEGIGVAVGSSGLLPPWTTIIMSPMPTTSPAPARAGSTHLGRELDSSTLAGGTCCQTFFACSRTTTHPSATF